MSMPLPPFNQRPTMEPTTRNYHTCPAPDCKLVVPNRLLSCSKHWRALPLNIRQAITAAYVPGQSIATASEAWKQAMSQAMAVWNLKAGKVAGGAGR